MRCGSEYEFELALCARLEAERERVVARQLGGGVAAPGRRVVDVVAVTPGPGFESRARITEQTIPPAVLEGGAGVGQAVRGRDAVDAGDRRDAVLDRAVELGVLERLRRDGSVRYRQRVRYPENWFDDLLAVENKPDLERPGDLERQLRYDASLALFDRVVLATESHVTRAHLNRIPEAVGVWRVDPTDGVEIEVVRDPARLPVGEPGVEPVERHSGRTEVRVVDPAAKRRVRRRVAERAYGKGWRPEPPACGHCDPTSDGRPHCVAFDRVVDPARDCVDCPERDPADPPAVDRATLRGGRTPWVADPPGVVREQSGLGEF